MSEQDKSSTCVFPNVRALAVALQRELRDNGIKLVARPYNRFDPFNSVWWLIPSTEWPAYSRGKLILIPDEGEVSIGLNLEKGVTGLATESRALVMTPEWQWYTSLEDMRTRIEEVAVSAVRGSGSPIKIRLGVIIVGSGTSSADPYSSPPSDLLQWVFDGDAIRIDPDVPTRLELGVAGELLESESLCELLQTLLCLSRSDAAGWYWFDLSLTSTLAFAHEEDRGVLDAADIMHVSVYPWLPWIE